jgi:hypothetical protein
MAAGKDDASADRIAPRPSTSPGICLGVPRPESVNRFGPAREDGLSVVHLWGMSNRAKEAKRQFVLHLIRDPSPVAFGGEAMLVMPPLARTFGFEIDQSIGAVALDNSGCPIDRTVDRKNSPAQRAPNQPIPALLRSGEGSTPKMRKWRYRWNELRQILGFREKLEHIVWQSRNELLSAKNERRYLSRMHGLSFQVHDRVRRLRTCRLSAAPTTLRGPRYVVLRLDLVASSVTINSAHCRLGRRHRRIHGKFPIHFQ